MKIQLCMGSSCYSRGNQQALAVLEEFIAEKGLENQVELKGAHCMGDCSAGPIITIDEKRYQGLHPCCIPDIVMFHLGSDQ